MPDRSSRERATATGAPGADGGAAARAGTRLRGGGGRGAPEALPAAPAGGPDEDLLLLAMPVLEQLATELAPSGQVLSLLDAGGWILWTGGSARSAERRAEAGFRPGERWDVAMERASGAAAAATGGSPLEPPADGRWRRADEWITSVAAIAGAWPRAPAALVHVAAPGRALEGRELMGARAVARVIRERLDAAVAVRDQVVENALRGADDAQARVFAVDAAARVIGASDAARSGLALGGDGLPAAVREVLAALLAASAGIAARPAPGGALEVDWPGGAGRVRLRASLIRYREQVLGAMVRVVEARRSRAAHAPEPPAALARYGFDQLLGASGALRAAIALARTAARNDLPVVLSGESGTGKELLAHAIHGASARRAGPFVAVSCGCIPASLLEAELFGYEPGTFTGGRSEGNAGKFEKADGGTLLLDEVDELSPQGQAALLRVLQEREVVRLGGSAPRRVDVRVVTASHRSLGAEMRAGRFRADLYFRLNVLAISVPPLRERRGDVKLLAEAFLRGGAAAGGARLALSPAAIAALEAYDWPGNVRELRNVILRSAATAAGEIIDVPDLPAEVLPARPGAPPFAAAPPDGAADAPRRGQREALLRALASSSSWNLSHAAAALHVSRTTLYRWLRKHHIDR